MLRRGDEVLVRLCPERAVEFDTLQFTFSFDHSVLELIPWEEEYYAGFDYSLYEAEYSIYADNLLHGEEDHDVLIVCCCCIDHVRCDKTQALCCFRLKVTRDGLPVSALPGLVSLEVVNSYGSVYGFDECSTLLCDSCLTEGKDVEYILSVSPVIR